MALFPKVEVKFSDVAKHPTGWALFILGILTTFFVTKYAGSNEQTNTNCEKDKAFWQQMAEQYRQETNAARGQTDSLKNVLLNNGGTLQSYQTKTLTATDSIIHNLQKK